MAVPARLRNSLALIVLLAGCAGGPQPPDWRESAVQALGAFQRLYFAGKTEAAEAQFRVARTELARTGRVDLVARAELVRCAVRAATLEFDDCPQFERLRYGAGAEEAAYADYLLGKARRPVAEEPLSRLVAHAVHLKTGEITPAGIAAAVEVASAQGWRRPLLAWIGLQLERAEKAGDSEAVERLRRRMELIAG